MLKIKTTKRETPAEYLRQRLNVAVQFTLGNDKQGALANLARYCEERLIVGSEPPTGGFIFRGTAYDADSLAVELMLHAAAGIGRGERNA